MKTITANALGELVVSNADLPAIIDVRTPAEHEDTHIEGSRLHPLESLDPQQIKQELSGDSCYILCRSGARATKAIEKLSASGMDNLVLIEGGIQAWEEAGLPVNKGRKMMSLERQVRIAAGFMVLLGAVLGFTVHPNWHALSGFVGAGLMFAGITDTCGMGMLIAKMPWNQKGGGCCDAPAA
jgi:rhodanese-related sulfurtransferase